MATEDQDAKTQFNSSLDNANDYPRNLLFTETYLHALERYKEQLLEAEKAQVFCSDQSRADVLLREIPPGQSDFKETHWKTVDHIKSHFSKRNQTGAREPMCSFYFLQAPSSRDPLNITRDMLTHIFTYEQIMPQFLDYIFTFGYQQFPRDVQFCGLKHETRLCEQARGLHIADRGRKGRTIQLCYNLKSPEQFYNRWSVRQTAAYHSFDVDTGRTACVIVKGNKLIQKRVIAETSQHKQFGAKSYSSAEASFGASLESHLLLCDWAGENWKWYIQFLENEVQELSRPSTWVDLPRQISPTLNIDDSILPQLHWFPGPIRRFTDLVRDKVPLQRVKSTVPARRDTIKLQKRSVFAPPAVSDQLDTSLGFSFTDLQSLYSHDEKAKEALVMIQSNARTVKMLKDYYQSVVDSSSFPAQTKSYCEYTLSRFMNRLDQIVDDLRYQECRLESLLQIIANRKTLLSGTLEYVKTCTNVNLANEAQYTALQTHDLTEDMNNVALSTAQSTTSMKAITLVTFIFLPGTFISTIMSTDIIRFHDGMKDYSWEALKLYLKISVPLMAFSILFWVSVYRYSSQRAKKRETEAKIQRQLRFGPADNV